MQSWLTRHKMLLAVAVLLATGGFWWAGRAGPSQFSGVTFESVEIGRGAIRRIVSASGSVRPLVTVEIGSQLSGQIAELLVDYNDRVRAGQLIARIDPQTFSTRVAQAAADLSVAEAGVTSQQANLLRAEANQGKAARDYERQTQLADKGNISESALDAAKTGLETARADVAVARSQLAVAEAQVLQRQAALEQAQIDLARTEIRSPIDGVVIDRSVDVGQTVAASLSAPTLFQIAQDLSEIQVEASVDEADVGNVRAGNKVEFSVDAFPDRTFRGRVNMVRLAPVEAQNVVTYTVVITAGNPGRILLPGMTANVLIVTGERADVLLLPNDATRFRPAGVAREDPTGRNRGEGAAGAGGQGRGGDPLAELAGLLDLSAEQQEAIRAAFAAGRQRLFQGGDGTERPDPSVIRERFQAMLAEILEANLTAEQMALYRATQSERAQIRMARVWTLDDNGEPVPLRVRLGLVDNRFAELLEGLSEGDRVIVRQRVRQQ